MKKCFLLIIFIICCLSLLCACKGKEVTVTYIANEGGYVYGESTQTIEAGEDCTQVYAVAELGYRFIGWSDGLKSSQRIDTEVPESKTITAQFEKIEYVTVEYIASEGGAVYGKLNQKVEAGEDCTQVYAVAETGYRFIGWSDGLKGSQRIDTEVLENRTITARFEEILVLFYSEESIVRSYTLKQFADVDILTIVGYACAKDFEGWRFNGQYSGLEVNDPLIFIKNHYILKNNIPDITLEAVYSNQNDVTLDSYKTIAHAFGGIDGNSYVNSLEAFEYWYNQGQRFFETDITITSDGEFVATHDWSKFTFNDFMLRKTIGYTPLSLVNILELLQTHTDIFMYFDAAGISKLNWNETTDEYYRQYYSQIENFINDNDCEEMYDRIILEIVLRSDSKMFELAKANGKFKSFVYAYELSDFQAQDEIEMEVLCDVCAKNEIYYLTIRNISETWVEIAHQYGLAIMAYTYNDTVKIYELYDIGVDFVFTDFSMLL